MWTEAWVVTHRPDYSARKTQSSCDPILVIALFSNKC